MGWYQNHVEMYDRSWLGEKGFLLRNGTFFRYEPPGIIWNDSFCRRIGISRRSGCFVEREIELYPIDDIDNPQNNCSGEGSTDSVHFQTLYVKSIPLFCVRRALTQPHSPASGLNGRSANIVHLMFSMNQHVRFK